MWAGIAGEPAWLRGAPAVPHVAAAGRPQPRVERLLALPTSAAWITRDGDAVLALPLADGDGFPIGELAATPIVEHLQLWIGRWPDVPAAALARTARLTVGTGEDDDCGGADPYTLTVRPDPAAPAIGASWTGDWVNENC